MDTNLLSALYYPFSRCIDANAVKHLLLVFEGVTFLDPVTDDEWRAHLMEDMIHDEDPRFVNYRDLHQSIDELRAAEAISIVPPDDIAEDRKTLAAASALSDLTDRQWCRVAGHPQQFSMPHRRYATDGSATWQIFKPKMPDLFVDALHTERNFRRHLILDGGEHTAWTLSYEAGSAISISLHLAAAEQLTLAPVTDSSMHHQLMLQKYAREYYGKTDDERPVPPAIANSLAQQTVFALVQGLLPQRALQNIRLNEVIAFRKETEQCRALFIADLSDRFALCKSETKPEHLNQLLLETRKVVLKELNSYQSEMAAARDKVWPNLVASIGKSLAAGSVTAVTFNFIAGPGCVLAGSILASAMSMLKGLLDIRTEMNKAKRSASPSVAYLSRLVELK